MSKKNTYYFSHDYNSRNDDKIRNLIRTHGIEGYGVYWCLIEDLYNNANEIQASYDGIAQDLRLDREIVRSVVEDFGLFKVTNNNTIKSLSVERRLKEREKISKKAKQSVNKRWKAYARNTSVSKPEYERNTNVIRSYQSPNTTVIRPEYEPNTLKERKEKEIKEKEIKEKEIKDVPSLWIATLGRNPKLIEIEETEKLIEDFGMEKTYQALKKAGLHGFKNLPNIIKRINNEGIFILEDEKQIITDERFDKPIGRLN